MAGSKSNYLESKVLKHVLGEAAFTEPTNTYLALLTGDPGETGDMTTEITGNAYARQLISWANESGGSKANGAAITFPTATPGNWGNIAFWAIMDASTSGNCLYHGTWDSSVTINAGNTHSTAIGGLVITED